MVSCCYENLLALDILSMISSVQSVVEKIGSVEQNNSLPGSFRKNIYIGCVVYQKNAEKHVPKFQLLRHAAKSRS